MVIALALQQGLKTDHLQKFVCIRDVFSPILPVCLFTIPLKEILGAAVEQLPIKGLDLSLSASQSGLSFEPDEHASSIGM
eukprot:2006254-Amphidinium_carterae.1